MKITYPCDEVRRRFRARFWVWFWHGFSDRFVGRFGDWFWVRFGFGDQDRVTK